jgi:hypothetical protein
VLLPTLTIEAVLDDFRAAGMYPTNGGADGIIHALCPACPGSVAIREIPDGGVEVACSRCDGDRIGQELRFRREARGTLAVPASTEPSTWAAVPLEGIIAGTDTDEPPTILWRNDGHALLYPGRVHALFGEPEACKGWIVVAASAQQLTAGHRVLYVDFEDTAASVVGRLLALGTDPGAVLDRFIYVRPEEPIDERHRHELERAAADASLAILDGVTEALALQGLDLASNSDIATWLELLPRPLARMGAAVLMIDHVVKDRENRGRYAIGAQHKLAGVDCAYSVQVITPFGRGRDGRVKIIVTKDRPGHVRGIADEGRVADVRLTSLTDGAVIVALETGEARTGSFRPTTLMERVSRAIEAAPGLTKRALRQAVKGKDSAKDLALEILISEGHIDARRDSQATRHHSLKPYRASDENPDRGPVARPWPDRGPPQSADTVAPWPPLKGTGHGPHPAQDDEPWPTTEDDLDRADRLLNDHPEAAA